MIGKTEKKSEKNIIHEYVTDYEVPIRNFFNSRVLGI